MPRPRLTLLATALVSAAALGASVTAASASSPKPPIIQDRSTVEVQVLALNDFHGNLIPPSGSSGRVGSIPPPEGAPPGVVAGGAEYLATHVKNLEATNRNSLVVSAGDLIGASPLVSALFHDEPTIEAMNLIGLDLNAVGNHEFDEGATELRRMQDGGCHPVDGCLDGDPFAGADFDFLAANVIDDATGRTLFAPYSIQNFTGARVAFIGMTLEGTPTIVSAAGIAGYSFRDEADTVNALVPELRRRGVESIVVLVHEGGIQTVAVDPTTINTCTGISGPIVDIVNRLDDAVDLVISGHTHQAYNCQIDGKAVTSAYSFGRVVTDIDMKVDRRTGDTTSISVNNRVITRDVDKDPRITSLIDRYSAIAAPIANRPIGQITADITRTIDDSLEQALGNVIADGQLEATNEPDTGAAVLALMNPGGVRADLTYAGSIAAGEGDGVVTYGEAFTVQPFGNALVTLTLTGAQIETILEQQFCGTNSTGTRVLLPSAGLRYTWDLSEGSASDPTCARDVVTGITLNGTLLDPVASYRVTANNFLTDGGDGFTGFLAGTDRLGGDVDTDAFEAYITEFGPLAPAPRDRIDLQP